MKSTGRQPAARRLLKLGTCTVRKLLSLRFQAGGRLFCFFGGMRILSALFATGMVEGPNE